MQVAEIDSLEWKRLVIDGAGSLGVSVDIETAESFAVHAQELLLWNRKINLTSITDPLEIAVKHFIDAIAPANLIHRNAKLLDIGSGAGFPGIPLKLLIPSISAVMIDASRKKAAFIQYMVRKANLENACAFHKRAEDLVKKTEFRNVFDVIVSRALSGLDKFVELSVPLVKRGGLIIAYKGSLNKTGTEIRQLQSKLLPVDFTIRTYRLPFLNLDRTIVKIVK